MEPLSINDLLGGEQPGTFCSSSKETKKVRRQKQTVAMNRQEQVGVYVTRSHGLPLPNPVVSDACGC